MMVAGLIKYSHEYRAPWGLHLIANAVRPLVVMRRVDSPKGKIQSGIDMSRQTEEEVWGKISRLEERTDGHGEGNREIRQKQREQEIDIKDLYKQINSLNGALKLARWLFVVAGGVVGAAIEWFRKT